MIEDKRINKIIGLIYLIISNNFIYHKILKELFIQNIKVMMEKQKQEVLVLDQLKKIIFYYCWLMFNRVLE